MDVFITHQRITGLNVHRKSIIAAIILTMIMGFFVGCEEAYTPTAKEPAKVSAPTPTEIAALSDEIKQLVKGLEYSDKVSEDFAEMVIGWKGRRGQPILVVWKKKLAKERADYKQGKISKERVSMVEVAVMKELAEKVRKEISPSPSIEESFDLADVVKNKQAQCLGNSQIFYILGNSIGLSVRIMNVVELEVPALMPEDYLHVTCLVSLADDKVVMIDLSRMPIPMISTPFELVREFEEIGNYLELKDDDNPLRIHRRIQILDRNGLIADIYSNRATNYAKLDQPRRAISYFDRAINLNPKFAGAYFSRGGLYLILGAYSAAIYNYDKAIELNPKHAGSYRQRGTAFYARSDRNKAIFNYTKAIELNPEDVVAYYNRGNVFVDLQQYNKAIDDYTKIIELDPNYVMAYTNRGHVYLQLREYSQVIDNSSEAIRLNPESVEAYVNRGIAYRRLGEFEQAISDFDAAIKLNPEFASAYKERANAYVDRIIKLALKKDLLPDYPGHIQLTQAIGDYTIAIRLNLKSAEVYYGRGLAYGWLGRLTELVTGQTEAIPYYTNAISDYTEAIKLNPKYAEAHNNRGGIYAHLGKLEEAKEDLLKAVKLNPALKSNVKIISGRYKLGLKLH